MNRTRELVKRWNDSSQQEMGTTFGIEIGIGKPENWENEKRKSEIRNRDQKNENRKYENTSRIRKTNLENRKIRKTKNEKRKYQKSETKSERLSEYENRKRLSEYQNQKQLSEYQKLKKWKIGVLWRERERERPTFFFRRLRGCNRESRGEIKRKSGGERKKESRGERMTNVTIITIILISYR